MSNQANRAVIWIAVSSEEQATEEKVSLEEQEKQCRAHCDEKGYNVVTTLSVPGYSRRESDVITAMEEFRAQGIYAYDDLRGMWQRKEFDVLVCYHDSRLGRSSTLYSFVVENVILSGAKIYCVMGGEIDRSNLRYRLGFGQIGATVDVDRLIASRDAAMTKRAQRGLPTARVIFSHKLIRNEQTGKAEKLIVDESKRRLWEDVASLLLRGITWAQLEKVLYAEFGHVDPRTGKPFRPYEIHDIVKRPSFWGHQVRHVRNGYPVERRRAFWVYDPAEDPPEGVLLFRDVHPPVYIGEQAQAVIAEMRRRDSRALRLFQKNNRAQLPRDGSDANKPFG
jgi:DNA invertase Pin-like site-specific DNA recombinase